MLLCTWVVELKLNEINDIMSALGSEQLKNKPLDRAKLED